MDNVAINISNYADALKSKMTEISSYPIDHKWHIFDPITKTERIVQGLNVSGYCIGRVKHGRYCDVIASKVTSDNSVWAANYTDCQWYTSARCRFVGRSGSYASALGGLVYANADFGSAYSHANIGSRLAFRGKIKIKNE